MALSHTFVIIFSTNLQVILNTKKANVIVGCIYCHPHMDLNELNDYCVNNLLGKSSKENKIAFLLGDFNIDLLEYNQDLSTYEFISSHMLILNNQQE